MSRLAKAIACDILASRLLKGWREEPRVPKGSAEGGQWTREPGAEGYWRHVSDAERTRRFEEWHEAVEQELFGWARKHGLSEDDAADLVQDTLAAAWGGLEQFDPLASQKEDESEEDAEVRNFRAWTFTIARNKWRDLGRQRNRQPSLESLDAPLGGEDGGVLSDILAAAGMTPEQHVVSREMMTAIMRAVSAFPEPFRQTARLVWMEGLEPSEAAERIGVSPATVRTRLFRARDLLLRKLPEIREEMHLRKALPPPLPPVPPRPACISKDPDTWTKEEVKAMAAWDFAMAMRKVARAKGAGTIRRVER